MTREKSSWLLVGAGLALILVLGRQARAAACQDGSRKVGSGDRQGFGRHAADTSAANRRHWRNTRRTAPRIPPSRRLDRIPAR